MSTITPYEKLTFSNDFLFCKILETKTELCKELVELIFGRKVKEIRNVRSQFSLKQTVKGKGVRFDIIFEDEVNSIYDFEMQTTDTHNLPKRSRYYQAMIDTSAIEQGIDYEDLPQSYIVFICTFNPFESGRHLYTFTNLCIEEPALSLGDKTQKVFLCTEGDKEDVSSEIMDFLDYVAGRKLEGKIAKELDAEVKNAREKEEWRAEYMQNMAAIMDAKREGHKEGIIQGGNNMLYELVQDGSISIDVASKKMGVSKKEFENKMNLCGYKQPKRT